MKYELHVYHHFDHEPGGADRERLDQILALVKSIKSQGEQIMSKADDINTKLDEIDTQTNEIASDIDTLLANGLEGLSKADADALMARLGTHADTLRGIAAKA